MLRNDSLRYPRRHQLRQRIRAVAIAISASVALTSAVLAGCAPAAKTTSDDATLTIVTSYGITDLETAGWLGPGFGYSELLMRPEANGVPTPWVLSSLQPVDALTWRLQINEGVSFVNGRPFDAAALVALLEWGHENNAAFAATGNFASASESGPLEVLLKTSAPTPALPNLFADDYVVPVMDVAGYKEVVAAGEDPKALLDAGIFTGPFRVVELDDRGAKLDPVESYWQGVPALDSVSIRFVPDATARVQAVQSGEADLALYVPMGTKRIVEGRSDSFYLEGKQQGLSLGLISNPDTPAMQDLAVRRAIFTATDYREIAEDVFASPDSLATGIYSDNFSYAVATQNTDVDSAKRTLDAAGWTPGEDGIRAREGRPLTIRVLCDAANPDHVVIAEAVQSQLVDAGIDVEVRVVDDFRSERQTDNWDIALTTAGLMSYGGSPDQAMTNLLKTGNENNWAGISDPDLDALLGKLAIAPSGEPRDRLLRDIQQMLWDRGYYAAAVQRLVTVVASAEWKDYDVPVSMMWVDNETAQNP